MLITYPQETSPWTSQEHLASELLYISNRLWLDAGTELCLLQKPLYNCSCTQIISQHHEARAWSDEPVQLEDTLALARSIAQMDIRAARVDLHRLVMEWASQKESFGSLDTFVARKLGGLNGLNHPQPKTKDIVLFGFGRIGRLVARLLLSHHKRGRHLRLRAVVLRRCDAADLLKRADLLRYDSVHGKFEGTVEADPQTNTLSVNGHRVQFIESPTPEQADYARYGITDALVIDSTGAYRDRPGLVRHLMAQGAKSVLLTAPAKGDVPNIVMGINHALATKTRNRVFAAASCTTNAIVPVLHAIDRQFGIENGHIETIHSYTNDQNLLDNYHKKYRRGRAAGLNLVITETGAGQAVASVLPHLAGKLTSNAVRVPTPNVSLAILKLNLANPTRREELNACLKEAALSSTYVEQVGFSTSNELVSSDVVGDSHAGVVDSPATLVSGDGRAAVIYVWYDNECGYAHQVVRLAKVITQTTQLSYR